MGKIRVEQFSISKFFKIVYRMATTLTEFKKLPKSEKKYMIYMCEIPLTMFKTPEEKWRDSN